MRNIKNIKSKHQNLPIAEYEPGLKQKFRSPPLCYLHNVSLKLLFCSLWNFVSVLSVGMPSIRPLETLHNALSLRQLDAFLHYVTATTFKTPCPSPRLRSPLRSNPFDFLATSYQTAVRLKGLLTYFHHRASVSRGATGAWHPRILRHLMLTCTPRAHSM